MSLSLLNSHHSSLLTASSLFFGSTLLFLTSTATTSTRTRYFLRNYLCCQPFKQKSLSVDEQIKYWEARDDENKFLEDLVSEKAINWVKEKNNRCLSTFGQPEASPVYQRALSILESKEKIPYVEKIGDKFYNFWKDDEHLRGIWRRTSFESYCTPSPEWEIVLDLDELGKQENKSWVYSGHYLFDLDPNITPTRTLIILSPGGSDANVCREFDLSTCQFVEDGFIVPESKSNVCWKSFDSLLVGTDFHDGNSLTQSGYPRVVHEWVRGTPLSSSIRVYEGDEKDINVHQVCYSHCGWNYEYRVRSLTFYTSRYSIKSKVTGEWRWHDLNFLPEDVSISLFCNLILITTRSDWTLPGKVTYPAGSLVSVPIDDLLLNGLQATFTSLFEASPTVSLDSTTALKSYLILTTLDDVKTRLIFWEYVPQSTQWISRGFEPEALVLLLSHPSRLYLLNAEDGVEAIHTQLNQPPLKSLPEFFDASNLVESQYFATSSDGTRVPYFILHSKNISYNSQNKTLLTGYGGFEITFLPAYSAVTGATWLTSPDTNTSPNTVFVFAGIRGGGEYGPKWHQSALKEKRYNCYNDFISVAEDLISRKITSPSYLAIRGGSNGGLLMGNMITRRPDLFASVICTVPLLDMKRYTHLHAGASWIAEYGDPDQPEEWNYLKYYSSYHNIDSVNGSSRYPHLLVTTSTKDDRVHPYHARSFIARLDSIGCRKHWYFENIEGGHGMAADAKQQAALVSLNTEFLFHTLGQNSE